MAKGATVPAAAAWGPGGGGGQQLTEGGFTGISFSCSGEKALRFAGILAEGGFTAIRQLRLPAAGRRAVRVLLILLLLLLLPAAPSAQADGSRMPGDRSGHPDNCHCPAAQPGMWALVVLLGVAAAASIGYILHTEVSLRRARKASLERARERSRAAAWGYPATAPPMPRV